MGVVEVLGPWLKNNGDVLNLWAVAQHFRNVAPVAASSNLGLRELPDEPSVRRIIWKPAHADFMRALRKRAPRKVLRLARDWLLLSGGIRSHSVAPGSEVAGLVDCSGYAYGDVWSVHRIEQRARHFAKLKAQGAKIVLLPQALGPFEDPEVRNRARDLFAHCDLIFARDDVSLAHLKGLQLASASIAKAPDITHLVDGRPPDSTHDWPSRVCVVPNARMCDRTDSSTGDRYLGFLQVCIQQIRDRGHEPCIMIHEKNDRSIANELQARSGLTTPVLDKEALAAKGILGACHAVIGSRYHALVSALSQGTPVLGTSWSHKYEELFDEYSCRDCLCDPTLSDASVRRIVADFLNPAALSARRKRLKLKAELQRREVAKMWEKVDGILDLQRSSVA